MVRSPSISFWHSTREETAMNHSVFTCTFPVEPARVDDIKAALAQVRLDRKGNPQIRFPELETVHFASFTLLPPDELVDQLPCSGPPVEERRGVHYLVFESNIDGKIEPYIDALVTRFPQGIQSIVCCCAGGPQTLDRESLRRYLLDHVVKAAAYHVGTPWRRMARIKEEARLRDAIEDIADTLPRPIDPAKARKIIQDAVSADPRLAFAKKPAPGVTLWDRIEPFIPLLPGLPIFLVRVLLILLTLPYVRWKEMHDCEWKGDVDPALLRSLSNVENEIAQNHMANMSDVKPGWYRSMTTRAIMMLASINARFSTKGTLGGIPSIHFAHWALLDGGKRILFCSNFDGSWENYLDDFIDKATLGLTGIWGNTIGFPTPRFLLWDGATNAARFKAIARRKQVPAAVWYSAYPKLTVQAIDNNSAIRRDLFRDLDAEGVKNWLRRL
jgi:hypothetical protein